MRTNVYIDGFNLYYRRLKGTPYKWLDLGRLFSLVLRDHEVHRIRYFTALVDARPDDPRQPERQQVYLRALRTIPNLTVHLGHFRSGRTVLPLADPPQDGPRYAEVLRTSEKGSDVNLATCLLIDAFEGDFEQAVVISNDSDLAGPIGAVRDRIGLAVGVLDPADRASQQLLAVSTFYRRLRVGPISASQFPTVLRDGQGEFRRPPTW